MGSKQMVINWELPLWAKIFTAVFFALFICWMLRGVYKNFLVTLIKGRYIGPAHLDSKVEEEYREVKTYANTAYKTVLSPTSGFRDCNNGKAYRLYFTVKGRCVELDVDKEIFDSLPDNAEGVLDYKGNMFYSFEVKK